MKQERSANPKQPILTWTLLAIGIFYLLDFAYILAKGEQWTLTTMLKGPFFIAAWLILRRR